MAVILRDYGHISYNELKQPYTAIRSEWQMETNDVRPEQLADARRGHGDVLFLRFADGFTAKVDLAEIGIDTTGLRLSSAHASWGSAVEIKTKGNDTIHIDSAVLRASCDPGYAAILNRVAGFLQPA
jgi:hypothetical protein